MKSVFPLRYKFASPEVALSVKVYVPEDVTIACAFEPPIAKITPPAETVVVNVTL